MMIEAGEIGRRARRTALAALRLQRIHRRPRAARRLGPRHGDVPLARGHYGAGYQLGLQTLRRAKMPKPLLYSQPANRPFFEAGRGLAWSLEKLGKPQMAEEVVDTLVELDPADPLQAAAMLDECAAAAHRSST